MPNPTEYPMTTAALEALPWKKVTSSNLEAIAYEADALYVRFASDAVYRYEVPREDSYDHLVEAEHKPELSVGKAFHEHLRKAGVTHTRIKIDDPQ
jgi:hypothetical protein